MPPRRKRNTDAANDEAKGQGTITDKESSEYKARRDRNNQAVKKSREKSRHQAKAMQDKVVNLRNENGQLEKQVTTLAKELAVLKNLFKLTHTNLSGSEYRHQMLSDSEVGSNLSKDQTVAPMLFTNEASSNVSSQVNHEALMKDHEYTANPIMK